MSEITKGAEGHHEWAARYGWDGVGFSEPEPSAWNRSTYAMLAAALEAHRALDSDCKVCREARAQ